MIKYIGILLALTLIACPLEDCEPPTGPSPPPDPPPVDDPPPDPEPDFNPGPDWPPGEWGDGFTAFGLCANNEQTQRQVWRSALTRGYKWGRVLSETGMWKGFWEQNDARGRRIGKGALEDLETCLRVAAEEGGRVLLVAVATSTRNSGRGTPTSREAWVRKVVRVSRNYNNIRYHTANEYWHPNSGLRNSISELNRLTRILQATGKPVGVDQNIGARFSNTARYRYDFKVKSDWPDFHPFRNPDPTRADIQDILRENMAYLPVVLSETTAYTDDPSHLAIFGRLVTTSRSQIQSYMDRCQERDGCIWLFHSVAGLLANGRLGWMPQRGMPQLEDTHTELVGHGKPLVDPNAQ